MSGLPDELTAYAAALSTPYGHPVVALIPASCRDTLAEGTRVLEPLRKFGSPLADLIGSMPYPAMQQMRDPVAPFGLRTLAILETVMPSESKSIQAADNAGHASRIPRLTAVREEVFRQTKGAETGIKDLIRGNAGGGKMTAIRFRKV